MSEVKFDAGKLVAIEGTEREIPAELVLLAMGFTGPETDTVVSQLGVSLDERRNIARDRNYATDVDGVFVCGDAGRGQSLIVWAIAEGRACAAGVDEYLSGSTKLPRLHRPDHPADDGLTDESDRGAGGSVERLVFYRLR